MGVFFMIGVIALMNFLFGFIAGVLSDHMRTKRKVEFEEKSTYCHGFEDGIYYTLDEYNPELFRPEIAEQCYKEYKAIKHGPTKH